MFRRPKYSKIEVVAPKEEEKVFRAKIEYGLKF